MSTVLFLNQPTVGHVNSLLSIADQMREDGHEVSFLVPGLRVPRTGFSMLDTAMKVPEMIRAHGIPVELLPPPPAVLWRGIWMPLMTGFAETLYAIESTTTGLGAYARAVLKRVARRRPDVIVTDFAFLATNPAAEAADIPYAVVYHSGLPFRGEGVPPFGSGLPIGSPAETTAPLERRERRVLRVIDARVNLCRRTLGLPGTATDVIRRPYSPWLNLIPGVAAAEAPRGNLTPTTYFIGPCFGRRKSSPFPFESLRADRFKIYVSLGTVFNHRPAFFRKILRSLDAPGYQVIVSAGGSFEALSREPVPDNATLYKSVPQVELLSRVDLFVTHGGNNSLTEALAAGVPVIVTPVGGEQTDNARRVEYLGVGRRLDIDGFSEPDLRDAVETIRTRPGFRERGTAIKTVIAGTDGLTTASRCIGWLARHRRPLVRPDGLPITLTPESVGGLVAG